MSHQSKTPFLAPASPFAYTRDNCAHEWRIMTRMSDIDELSFETAFEELETIITRLESGDLPLDESVELYERGRKLSERCQMLLDKAELRVNQLSEDGQIEPLE